jgi:hypothetical protein
MNLKSLSTNTGTKPRKLFLKDINEIKEEVQDVKEVLNKDAKSLK